MATGPAMGTLKEQTATHHDRVEAAVDLPARCCDLRSYRGLLVALEAFYRDLEPRLLADPGLRAILPDAPQRAKSAWLRADLRALGCTPRRPEATAAATLDVAGADRALGCLYVLEGATLGGAQIARAVQAALGLLPDAGSAFFTSYGADRGTRWRDFGAAVEARAAARGGLPAATVASARATFDAFEAHTVSPSHPEVLAA